MPAISITKIRRAILHADAVARRAAMEFFGYGYSRDATIMPVVVLAINRYGADAGCDLLLMAARLPQTAKTVDWALRELVKPRDLEQLTQDNYVLSLSLVLLHSPIELLLPRQEEIRRLRGFPDELRPFLEERFTMHEWGWDRLWREFERVGDSATLHQRRTKADAQQFAGLLLAMARFTNEGGPVVLAALQGRVPRGAAKHARALLPHLITLAGHMRLASAAPFLVRLLEHEDLDVAEGIGPALARIRSKTALPKLAEAWKRGPDDVRFGLVPAVEFLHVNGVLLQLRQWLARETNPELRTMLASALVAQLPTSLHAALAVARQTDSTSRDLRGQLATIATILGKQFPERQAWADEARRIAESEQVRVDDELDEGPPPPWRTHYARK